MFNRIYTYFAKPKTHRVFMDYASATPVRTEVREAMGTYTASGFANPSALYVEARQASTVLMRARATVAEFLNTTREQLVFTSGGTEGNNLAVLGVCEQAQRNGVTKPHVISVATEHPSLREVLDEVVRRGGEVTLLAPDADGLITVTDVMKAVRENTVLVSVMYVNNEIGVVQPVRDIAQAIKAYRKEKNLAYPYIHTDACQAGLLYTLDVSTLGVDLLTLDGLKVYGPAGVGCLYVRGGTATSPVMFGGGQEGGLRSGTENVAGIVGFATALSLARAERRELVERLLPLREYMIDQVVQRFPTATLNGSRKHRSPNNINVCFAGLDAEYLVVALDTYGVSASYSSSCRTLKEDSSSYVVEALGRPDCALSSIRFTLGRETTRGDVDFALQALEKAVAQVDERRCRNG